MDDSGETPGDGRREARRDTAEGRALTDGGDRKRDRDGGGMTLPERDVSARIGPDGAGELTAGSFEYRFSGGEMFDVADAPTPVDVFLGGLAACLSSSVAVQADIRDVELTEIGVRAEAAPAEGSVERISLTVTVDAAADPDVVERMVVNGERTCHVSELLREDLPVDLEWETA